VAKSPQAERLHFIDALRGLAALYVLSYHFVLFPQPNVYVPPAIRPLVLNGWSGVTLFFVISAFTLCFTLDRRKHEPHRTLRFYLRRFFRIVPLYYVWLAIRVCRTWGVGNVLAHKRELLLYLGFGFNFFPTHQDGLVRASWTLGVEMAFYMVFPFLFLLINKASRAILFLLATLIVSRLHFLFIQSLPAPAFDIQTYLYFSIFSQLPAFAVGMLAYFISRDFGAELRNRRLVSWLFLSLGGACFLLFPYFNKMSLVGSVFPMAVVYGLLVVGLTHLPISIMVNPVTVFGGAISYSLYLNHAQIVGHLAPIYSKHSAGVFHFFACYLIVVAAVAALSCITYRLIEQPGIWLGSRLIKQFASNSKNSPGNVDLTACASARSSITATDPS
jgi:peptidoglycan/LPS O-acetylase OafA/YrhL